ncbi:MAG: hypothetical protein AAF789_06545, partial [Bacteroidota bacterium]
PKWHKQRDIDWDNEYSVTFDLSGQKGEFVDYEIPLDMSQYKATLKTVAIEPALDAKTGGWEIEYISLF